MPESFDCGCVQTDGVTVDIEKTVAAYTTIAVKNSQKLATEVRWCKENGINGIVSDIAPFAFEVARYADIPSIAVTNFTWFDIYSEYCAAFPDFKPYIENIKRQYGLADLLLELAPPCSMEYFKTRKPIPPVGRVGKNIREAITESMGISPEKHLGLIYTGTFGMDSIPWKNLEQFTEWEFLGIYALPGAPKNYHCVSKREFRYQDVIASADVVVAKVGYGVYAECFLNGAALIYLPREGFAEYPVLEGAVREWGWGHGLSREDFYGLQWAGALSAVVSKKRPQPRLSQGAFLCAMEIEKTFNTLRKN